MTTRQKASSAEWREAVPIQARRILLRAGRQKLAAGVSRIERMLERRCGFRAFYHDQIIVLSLKAGRGKVRGTGAQRLAVELITLEVHQGAILVLDPYLDARRLGEVIENLCWLALGKLSAVEIDMHLDATIRGASRCYFGAAVRVSRTNTRRRLISASRRAATP